MTDPFEIFELEPSFLPDQTVVRDTFLRLIKSVHPDRFMDNEELYQKALDKTASINEAYKLLCNQQDLITYLLKTKEVLKEGDQLPADFLMDMMDINEAISEAEMEDDDTSIVSLRNQINSIESHISAEIEQLARQLDTNENAEDLHKIKNSLLKSKYILRLKERLVNFAPR